MIGFGSLFGSSGVFGKLFDSVGLGWLGNAISLAADVMTGNWLAAAKDVFSLVSQFSSSNSWMSKVSPFQPLGQFATNGCFSTGGLSQSRTADLRIQAHSNEVQKMGTYPKATVIIHETVQDRAVAKSSISQANMKNRA